MAHQHHHVPSEVSALALIAVAVLAPIVALLFGVLMISIFGAR